MIPASMPLDDLLGQLGDNDSDQLRLIRERTVQPLIEAEARTAGPWQGGHPGRKSQLDPGSETKTILPSLPPWAWRR